MLENMDAEGGGKPECPRRVAAAASTGGGTLLCIRAEGVYSMPKTVFNVLIRPAREVVQGIRLYALSPLWP
jgi:hypothetical protein